MNRQVYVNNSPSTCLSSSKHLDDLLTMSFSLLFSPFVTSCFVKNFIRYKVNFCLYKGLKICKEVYGDGKVYNANILSVSLFAFK